MSKPVKKSGNPFQDPKLLAYEEWMKSLKGGKTPSKSETSPTEEEDEDVPLEEDYEYQEEGENDGILPEEDNIPTSSEEEEAGKSDSDDEDSHEYQEGEEEAKKLPDPDDNNIHPQDLHEYQEGGGEEVVIKSPNSDDDHSLKDSHEYQEDDIFNSSEYKKWEKYITETEQKNKPILRVRKKGPKLTPDKKSEILKKWNEEYPKGLIDQNPEENPKGKKSQKPGLHVQWTENTDLMELEKSPKKSKKKDSSHVGKVEFKGKQDPSNGRSQ